MKAYSIIIRELNKNVDVVKKAYSMNCVLTCTVLFTSSGQSRVPTSDVTFFADIADGLSWDVAAVVIEHACLPASYHLRRHPEFASLMRFFSATSRVKQPDPGTGYPVT